MSASSSTPASTRKDLEGKTYWLLVERLENWNRDKRDGFKQFGIPGRKEKLARSIKKGDLLFFYVSSGRSSFADIREASESGIGKLPLGGEYDTPFPWCVHTRPVLTLPPEAWVSIKMLIPRLSLMRGKKDWRQLMRCSLRKLDAADAACIMRAMQKALKEKDMSRRGAGSIELR